MPLGNTSLQRLLGPSTKIGSLHGQILHCPIQRAASDHQGYVMSDQSYTVIPMYHPAAFYMHASWSRSFVMIGKQLPKS